jgi:ABC-type multidrug transport system permease subunit
VAFHFFRKKAQIVKTEFEEVVRTRYILSRFLSSWVNNWCNTGINNAFIIFYMSVECGS